MPLSEHEQRLLEQMERALHEEDPKARFDAASRVELHGQWSASPPRQFWGSARFGALLGGVITSLVILGVVGFLLMLGGTLMIGSAFRGPKQAAANAGTGTGSAAQPEACRKIAKELRWIHVQG